MNSQDFRSLQEAYMEVVMGEGKVAWDDKKNPNPSGLTPKEKSDAKRKQLGVDNPDNSSFEKGGPGEKEYARHGNLAAAQDKMSKRSTQPKGKPHEFKKSYLGKRTRGQYNRLFGAKVPKDKRSSYEPEKKNKNSPSFAESFYSENYDIYDIILSHLLDEGYADTQQQAEVIMVNMSEEWRESIVEGDALQNTIKTLEGKRDAMNREKPGSANTAAPGKQSVGAATYSAYQRLRGV